MNLIKPKTCLISVGAENTYGHPHKEVLDIINESGCKLFRTDLDGRIRVVVSEDGKVSVKSNF